MAEQNLFFSLLGFADRPVLLFGSIILAIPLYIGIGCLFFDNWQDFLEHLRYLYQPWWLSALRGEFYEDQWAGLKMLFYFIFCAATATTVYKLLEFVL